MLPSAWESRLTDLTEEHLACTDYVFVSAMVVQRESA